ncbi:MAG: flavodoxin domain-containing protein, partial [Poseidonia sp.]
MAVVAKVWIDEDCITCDACQDICPEVFEVTDDSSFILAAVRTDGVFDRNVGGAPLVGNLGTELGDIIIEAAEACPVEVIKYELVGDGAAEDVVEAAPAAVEAAAPAAAVAPAAGVSDALNAVFAGDRSINILFGSQTGNAAGLAEKTAKLAANYGLEPNIVDMDGFDPAKLASMKRVMIITSTWGEGEMPDNA